MKRKSRVYIIKLNRKILILLAIIVLLIIVTIIFKGSKVSRIFKYQSNGTIVIDPGHGGIDGGTSDKEGLLEKDINLDVGLKLKKELLAEEFKIIMTREKDQSLEEFSNINSSRYRRDLNARKTIINENDPLIFISIHVNSSKNSRVRGVKIYYYPTSSEGKKLAESICESVNINVYEKYLKDNILEAEIIPEDYFILRETQIPGVLVEIGFITNLEDNKLLKDEKYKTKIAFAIKKV